MAKPKPVAIEENDSGTMRHYTGSRAALTAIKGLIPAWVPWPDRLNGVRWEAPGMICDLSKLAGADLWCVGLYTTTCPVNWIVAGLEDARFKWVSEPLISFEDRRDAAIGAMAKWGAYQGAASAGAACEDLIRRVSR